MTPTTDITFKQKFQRIWFFFPLQLLWMHFKKNHLVLLLWAILFGFVFQNLAVKFGGPYLFLSPEYMGKVDFYSHFIIGFACGGFILSYNISSYITNGFRFPFIATLSSPFVKYSLNNFIIPLAFIGCYAYQLICFQATVEFIPWKDILINITGFLGGLIFFLIIGYTYFFSTNKSLSKLFEGKEEELTCEIKPVSGMFYKSEKWYKIFNKNREWRITTYLSNFNRIALARESGHYDKKMLEQVFRQNHINASLFEILILISIFLIGTFRASDLFQIPAGASIFLFFTMLLMITSAFRSWLKGWVNTVFILLFIIINMLSAHSVFNYKSSAYGMNYDGSNAIYSTDSIYALQNNETNLNNDINQTIEILNHWRKNNPNYKNGKKPKLVILNTSGGGLRSALWSLHAVQYIDSLTHGKLMQNTQLISGSSGGIIGLSYLRELYLRSKNNKANYLDSKYTNNISKDILNPIAFTLAVNDLFFRFQHFKIGNHSYVKDRGYAFEQQLNANTGNILNKTLFDYKYAEAAGEIPMMILAPTISNDARRLLISSQPISYLVNTKTNHNVFYKNLVGAIEFRRFFKNQNADSLLFTSALRMNATFPYVMPNTSLPSEPEIQVMDAGLIDNFGMQISLKYLYTFRNWISTNTSGVVIVELRDKQREIEIEKNPHKTIIQSITSPLGSFYGNITNIQEFHHDELMQYASSWFDGDIDVIQLQLEQKENDKISLSWHLTEKEKRRVKAGIYTEKNKKEIKRLQLLLK